MKTVKQLLRPERLRQVPEQFSRVDHALVQRHLIDRCDARAAALYLFLVTVADAQGLSYYGSSSLAQRLHLSTEQLGSGAPATYRTRSHCLSAPLYQVLALPGTGLRRARRRARRHRYATRSVAADEHWSHLHYLTELLGGEAAARDDIRVQRCIKLARFPVLKTLDQFDWNWPTRINRPLVQNLFHLEFALVTTNRIYKDRASIFDRDAVLTSALLHRLLHHAETVLIEGKSYRFKDQIERPCVAVARRQLRPDRRFDLRSGSRRRHGGRAPAAHARMTEVAGLALSPLTVLQAAPLGHAQTIEDPAYVGSDALLVAGCRYKRRQSNAGEAATGTGARAPKRVWWGRRSSRAEPPAWAAFGVVVGGWSGVGQPRYPKAREVTITADGRGTSGHRARPWKLELSRLVRETGLDIHAEFDSDVDMTATRIEPGSFLGEWNYRIRSR